MSQEESSRGNSGVYSSARMTTSQNEVASLRLLLAQRRLYSKAKFWLGLRWIGMLLIGIVAPVLSALIPDTAVIAGAVAGVWLFLGRTTLLQLQKHYLEQGAATQEQFDYSVYGIRSDVERSRLPSYEDLASLTGDDDNVRSEAEKEQLIDWYPIDTSQPGERTMAVCQRANASYSDNLLRTTAIVWAVALVSWVVILVIIAVALGLTLAQFLLGVAFPLLPAFLDIYQHVRSIRSAAVDRRDLVRAIENELRANDCPDPQDLLVWQERLFELRRSDAQVPDFIYKLRRRKNEAAMTTAAQQVYRRQGGDGNGQDS